MMDTWKWNSLIRVMYLQSYQLSQDSTDSTTTVTTGQLKVTVKPRLNVAYPAVFNMHATDCSSSPTGLPTVAFTAAASSKKDGGKSAKAIKVFEKGKSDEAGSITLDEFLIDLPDSQQTASQMVADLARKINATLSTGANDDQKEAHFGTNAEEYKKGPYKASKGGNAKDCGVVPSKWESGSACLILTRVLHGTAGNAELKYEKDYTEAK